MPGDRATVAACEPVLPTCRFAYLKDLSDGAQRGAFGPFDPRWPGAELLPGIVPSSVVRVFQSTEKLVPQPQADFAFGLRTAKWLPISSSV